MNNATWDETVRPSYRSKTVKVGNCTVVVHRPILTEAERVKREERVINTLAQCKSLATN